MMPRRVFFSFHYANDVWRTSQVRNIRNIDGNRPCTDNEWESVKRGGDAAIKRWIDGELRGKSCTIVLIGSQTANRPWVRYEIEKSWNDGKALMGIHINGLYDQKSQPSLKGQNPFAHFMLPNGQRLSEVVPVYDPYGWYSTDKYATIANNLENWIEYAISVREAVS